MFAYCVFRYLKMLMNERKQSKISDDLMHTIASKINGTCTGVFLPFQSYTQF